MEVLITPNVQNFLYGFSIVSMAIIGVMAVSALIPLDSVPAVAGVTIITSIAYAISLIVLLIALFSLGRGEGADNRMIWFNTYLLLLVVFPATISATAMNVTTVQNTRNLLAGKVTA